MSNFAVNSSAVEIKTESAESAPARPETKLARLDTINSLRGFASFAVCWYHFTNSYSNFLDDGLLKFSGKYGWLGVEIFFVISGFVIPYALYQSKFQWKNYPRFLLKRALRLDPPYFVIIILTITFGYLTKFAIGKPFQASLIQVLLHFGYLNVFFHYQWLSVTFWTLAIEAQYYILIGLGFPLLLRKASSLYLLLLLPLGLLAAYLPVNTFIVSFIALFVMGILAFQFKIRQINKWSFIVLLSITAGFSWVSIGQIHTVTGLITTLLIVGVNLKNRLLDLFGRISYSLYLIHPLSGMPIIYFAIKLCHNNFEKLLAVLLATVVSVLIAELFYRYVERPSQQYASAISWSAIS